MRNVTEIARKSAGLSRRCGACPLHRKGCNLEMNRACFDSFVEFRKDSRKELRQRRRR
mgnify:CR=1 FL=1